MSTSLSDSTGWDMLVPWELSPVCTQLHLWGSDKPEVRTIWVYGNRVSGCYMPESDLDIAVEFDPAQGSDIAERLLKALESEIQPTVPFKLDIRRCTRTDPDTCSAVSTSGITVYRGAITLA